MLGSRGPSHWLGGPTKQERAQRTEGVEELDPGSLAARIGCAPREQDEAASQPAPTIAQGNAAWRRALRSN